MSGPSPWPGSRLSDDELHAALAEAVAGMTAISPSVHDRPVPSCPGWVVADVIEHTARIHEWAARTVRDARPERRRREHYDLPDGTVLAEFAARAAADLLATLTAADLDLVIATFVGPRPTRWWLRRQVHETAIHRWDAECGAGSPAPLPAAVAIDTVDELLDVFVPRGFDRAAFGGTDETTIHLHATDAPGEWLVRVHADGVTVRHEHAKGDVAARGTASDLALFVWNRLPGAALETFGDPTILDRFQAGARF